MKLGVLFSGGKDSCLALHRAVAAGHEVACLLTLLPERDDSWMFHTPALEWTALQAEALGIAQLTAATPGEPEAELADMQALLARAQRKYGIAGVVTGALASVYQATRIQRACADLGLWCFNPLWQLPQTQLLEMLLAERYEVVVTAVAAGTATVTATSGSASATASVTVAQAAANLVLSDSILTFASLADTTQLTATVTDVNGQVIDSATVTWTTSNDAVATVSSTGLVTSVADGSATITATSGSVNQTAAVTVSQAAASVTLAPTSLSFASFSDTTTLVPTVKDANNNTIPSPTVTWATSSSSVATVSSAGLVTAVADGSATITATSGSVNATATATVSQVASSVTLSPTSLSFTSVGDTATFVPTVKDAGGTTISGATVTWATSSSSVATAG